MSDAPVHEKVSKEMLVNRLKRVEGQVRGVEKMIDEGRDCESIVTQLAAVRSAIEGVGALLLNNYMQLCFWRSEASDSESVTVDSLARAVAIWGRVRVGEDNR
ncbi:MAG: metal-sensitive transcriptional regulator [Dehalococcoidia bacterium]